MGFWTALGLPSSGDAEHNARIEKLRAKAKKCPKCQGTNQKIGFWQCCSPINEEIEFLTREWEAKKAMAGRCED